MPLFAIMMSSITGIENYFRIKWNAMRCLKKIFEGILNVILNLWNQNYDASNTFKFPRFHLDAMYFPFMKYTLKSLLYTQNYCQCVQESQKVFSNTLDVFFAQMEVKQYRFEVRFKKHPGFDNFCDIKKVVWNILVFWPYISSRIRDTNCKNCGHSVFELLHITVSQSITVVVEFLPSSQFARNFSRRCPSVRKLIYPNIVLAASRQTFTKN